MNAPMMEAARHMPPMMGQMLAHPMSAGAMMAAGGYAAGKGLLGGLLRHPLVFVAVGLAGGYLLHKYEKEIVAALSKAAGIGKDFALAQKENLDDLLAESQEAATPAAPSAPPQTQE